MKRLFQKWKRITRQKRHERMLEYLHALVYIKYQKSTAKIFGKTLSKDDKTYKEHFKNYFKTYHFEKNFYSNYHAIHRLFEQHYQLINIPKKFYVYDIACGPYTATISLLNFLERNKTLKGREFSFMLCEHGDFTLEMLKQAFKENSYLFFPIPYFVQIRSEFDVNNWHMCLNQCLEKDKYGCKNYAEKTDIALHSDADAINLIFCSYAGERDEEKFIHCIENTFTGFSPRQKTYPTYIIYSHYIGRFVTKKRISDIKSFIAEPVIESKEPLPFSNYYYLIFKVESCRAGISCPPCCYQE